MLPSSCTKTELIGEPTNASNEFANSRISDWNTFRRTSTIRVLEVLQHYGRQRASRHVILRNVFSFVPQSRAHAGETPIERNQSSTLYYRTYPLYSTIFPLCYMISLCHHIIYPLIQRVQRGRGRGPAKFGGTRRVVAPGSGCTLQRG